MVGVFYKPKCCRAVSPSLKICGHPLILGSHSTFASLESNEMRNGLKFDCLAK